MRASTRISASARRLRPRKRPAQARAQDTVEALLQATAELLERGGYARLTTNHVAQRAGVSVGSLYQYFPNKEALCHALAERHFQRHTERYLQHLDAMADAPVERQVHELVRISAAITREDPAVARNLYAELARIGGLDPSARMRDTIAAALAARFGALPPRQRPADPERCAYVVINACSLLIGDAAQRRPAWLEEEAFLNEIARLVLGYYAKLGWE